MDRGRIGLIAAIAALAAAVLVTAGCGGGGALSIDPVAAAATKTQNAGAARVRFTMRMNGMGHSFAFTGKGVMDGTSADMTFDLGSIFRQAGLPASGMGSAQKAKLAHASMREIMVKQNGDFLIYLRFPHFMAEHMPGGKQWVEMDLTKLEARHGVNMSQLMSGSGMNPGDLLGTLESEGAKVTTVGPETIDGAPTTHYSVKIDTAKMLRSKKVTSPYLNGLAKKMPTLPEDVWVGKDGLVRRVALTMKISIFAMRMTMDMSDYGTHATIAAPPKGDVFDMTSLVAKHMGSSSSGSSGGSLFP